MTPWYWLAVLPLAGAAVWAAVWLPVLFRHKRALDEHEARFGERLDDWGREMLVIRNGWAGYDNRCYRAFAVYHAPVALIVAALRPIRPGAAHNPIAASVLVILLTAAAYTAGIVVAVRLAG